MAKYRLIWPKRVEATGVLKAGDTIDLAKHYTPEQIARLLRESQYQLVEEPVKKVVK